MASPPKYSHAQLDVSLRRAKAKKIQAILSNATELCGARVLEIGTGSGAIAQTMAFAVGPEGVVTAVDVVDQRQVQDGFQFLPVVGTALPFEARSFDVVISNHVLEHVGDRSAQMHHLREIGRVLTDAGVGYLAVPNRWRLIEPHFGLPLLSWFPVSLRSAYVRFTGRGEQYDCNPPSHRELATLLHGAGLRFSQQSFQAMQVMAEVEPVGFFTRLLLCAPKLIHRLLYPIIPTMIFLLRRST